MEGNDTPRTHGEYEKVEPPAPNPTANPAQADCEKTMYPTASQDLLLWMREKRGMIRAFLESPYGRDQEKRDAPRGRKNAVRAH